mmetsp:Transcript_632/g.759  ORF Transcript_632/g.759 Transcript_632/m.759 type:complete len:93 (-) Transcript_632:355-633(-)
MVARTSNAYELREHRQIVSVNHPGRFIERGKAFHKAKWTKMKIGGVKFIANIRGVGEYGPSWHQSALQSNRNKCRQKDSVRDGAQLNMMVTT